VLVRVLVDAVERAGIGRDELLGGARFELAMLEDAGARVDFEAYEELRGRAVALTHDDALGLRMAQQATEASFDLLAPLVSHAPTMRGRHLFSPRLQAVERRDSQARADGRRKRASARSR